MMCIFGFYVAKTNLLSPGPGLSFSGTLIKFFFKVFIFLDEKHLEKYQETYELVRTVIDENGGECRC